MEDNLFQITKEFEELKGQLVITQLFIVERLIAIGEDEHDYYYITYDGKKVRWNTCVGRIIRLKDRISDLDYAMLSQITRLNDPIYQIPKAYPDKPELLEEYKGATLTLAEGDKLITEVEWQII